MPVLRVPIGSDGPVVDLVLWIGRAAAHALIARGRAVATPQTIRALIDTGASRTAIHPAALGLIHSPPAGTAKVRRPGSTGACRVVDLHGVRLAFAGVPTPSSGVAWVEIEAVAVTPADPGIVALIGRDMLAHCQFLDDGWSGKVRCSWSTDPVHSPGSPIRYRRSGRFDDRQRRRHATIPGELGFSRRLPDPCPGAPGRRSLGPARDPSGRRAADRGRPLAPAGRDGDRSGARDAGPPNRAGRGASAAGSAPADRPVGPPRRSGPIRPYRSGRL